MSSVIVSSVQKICVYVLGFTMSSQSIEQLSAQLDARQKLISDLQAGVQATQDILSQLQTSIQAADAQIADLTTQVTDNAAVKGAVDQVQAKNSQLQGLVQKLGSSIPAPVTK